MQKTKHFCTLTSATFGISSSNGLRSSAPNRVNNKFPRYFKSLRCLDVNFFSVFLGSNFVWRPKSVKNMQKFFLNFYPFLVLVLIRTENVIFIYICYIFFSWFWEFRWWLNTLRNIFSTQIGINNTTATIKFDRIYLY